MRSQHGTIKRIGPSWYGRWREDVIVNGELRRQQRFVKLCEFDDRYRTKADVRPLLNERLVLLNEGRCDARSSIALAAFVTEFYEPYIRENCKPSTVHGYNKLWKDSLCPWVGDIRLRDFRTVDAANLLQGLAARGWGRRSLQHAKSLLSGIFTYAKNLGFLDGLNPIRDAIIPRKAPGPSDTHASTPDEVLAMLVVLENARSKGHRQTVQARIAIGMMFFAGLRPGEARGARWEHYDGSRLEIKNSVWRKHVTDPKTANAAKPVPVIGPLRDLLAELNTLEGCPAEGPILRGPKGNPLNLEMLAKRVIRPALNDKGNYRSPDAKPITWHGFYALRRGIATHLTEITRDPNAAKGLLRHTSLSTTLTHYIKDMPKVTANGLAQVEELFGKLEGPVQ
jgi:integrase